MEKDKLAERLDGEVARLTRLVEAQSNRIDRLAGRVTSVIEKATSEPPPFSGGLVTYAAHASGMLANLTAEIAVRDSLAAQLAHVRDRALTTPGASVGTGKERGGE